MPKMEANLILISLIKLLLVHLLISHLTSSAPTTNFTDLSALLALKSQFVLKPNDKLTRNWTINSSFCDWIGVSCGLRHKRVTGLNVSYMDLQGTISPHIGNLSFLTFFDIRNNSFHGPLPETIGRLQRLRLINLRFNQLGGNIPSSLSECKRLESILFGPNNFEGNIPGEIGELSSLQILQINNNYLTGIIPSSVFNISTLRGIDITANNISGGIPMDICNGLPNLQFLYLSSNPLGGSVPTSLCQCKDLQEIELVENGLTGSIPRDIGCLSKLEYVDLARNHLTGIVPPSLGNLSRLLQLDLIDNNLWGEIPEELTRLSNIKYLRIAFNNLSGRLPEMIFNLSSAESIAFMENNITGNIPEFTSHKRSELRYLDLFRNRLGGKIPNSISNASQLTLLELSKNYLNGPIPIYLGNLRFLETLNLQRNQLTNDPSQEELHFLTFLTHCRNLKNLVIGLNPLNGELPNTIGNLSTSLQIFSSDASQLRGSLPSSVGNLTNLLVLELAANQLTREIPSSVGNLGRLQRLRLFGNNMEGKIPSELCRSAFLGEFLVHENKLSGPIPDCIGNLTRMQALSLSSNALESIPTSLWSLNDMWFLNLSVNSLHGYLPPNIEKLQIMENLDLSKNQLSGSIPASISSMKMLKQLNLSDNLFEGSIPDEIGKLASLESLDLSSNNFTGAIPKSLQNLSYLGYLNLSYNKFNGEVPSGGIFKNLSIQSFLGNGGLCGLSIPELPACPSSAPPKWRKLSFWLRYVFPPVASGIILFILVILYSNHGGKSKEGRPSSIEISAVLQHQRFISYNELVHATGNFSEENLLGAGSFGSVYKGTMPDGELIAVKVFNLKVEGGWESFDKECDVLRNVRHRNLLKIVSSCSNLDFRALIFPFLPNGSLEMLLHSKPEPLDFLCRFNIMFDVASGMEYLHHGYSQPVVHCDLKPSNVLLDHDMVAHVSDFGIAKLLGEYKSSTTLTTNLGTVGYIAPEYGLEGKASTKGDVYSYGIMLLEIFTRKRPTDEMFIGGLSLRQWVQYSFPDEVIKIVDANLFAKETLKEHLLHCLSSIIELALLCSNDSPEGRPDMKEVLRRLTKIKRQFLSIVN